MVIGVGEKVHVVYRSLYENSVRRHFIGEVRAQEDAVCRIEGYLFVYDPKTIQFVRKPERRTMIMDLAASNYVVNVIPREVDLAAVSYRYLREGGLVATDGKQFSLDINEFGTRR